MGMTLKKGDYCRVSIPGINARTDRFEIRNGQGCYGGICSGNDVTFNEFRVSKNSNGSWNIRSVPSDTPPPKPDPTPDPKPVIEPTPETVLEAESDDATKATLRGLTISDGTLDQTFKSGDTEYTASVSEGEVTVTPTASNPDAPIVIRGATVHSGRTSEPQPIGEPIYIRVTSEDGSDYKVYTVNFR